MFFLVALNVRRPFEFLSGVIRLWQLFAIGGLITVTFLSFFWNCFKSYIVVAAAVVHLNFRIVFKMMLLLRLLLLLPRLMLLLLLLLLLWLLLSLLVIVLLLVLCVVCVHNAAGLIPGD